MKRKMKRKKMINTIIKYIVRLSLVLILCYTLYFQIFKTLFEVFNKSKYENYWLSVFKYDFSNLIIICVLVYTIIRILQSVRVLYSKK